MCEENEEDPNECTWDEECWVRGTDAKGNVTLDKSLRCEPVVKKRPPRLRPGSRVRRRHQLLGRPRLRLRLPVRSRHPHLPGAPEEAGRALRRR